MKKSIFIIVPYLFLICNTILGQGLKPKIDGSEPFVIKYNRLEMLKNGETFSRVAEVDAQVSFTPTSKNAGILSFTVDGKDLFEEAGTKGVNVEHIRQVVKDGKIYYLSNDINDFETIYVWSLDFFLYTNGGYTIQLTN